MSRYVKQKSEAPAPRSAKGSAEHLLGRARAVEATAAQLKRKDLRRRKLLASAAMLRRLVSHKLAKARARGVRVPEWLTP